MCFWALFVFNLIGQFLTGKHKAQGRQAGDQSWLDRDAVASHVGEFEGKFYIIIIFGVRPIRSQAFLF